MLRRHDLLSKNKQSGFIYKKRKLDLADLLQKHWFLVGILLTILLAILNPYIGSTSGPLRPEYSVKYGAVSLIFILSGYTLRTEARSRVVRQYKLHLYVQIFTFIVIPIIVQIITLFLYYAGVDVWILRGIITLGCMPPPVSSAVILTRSAGGNEAAAIFNSVLGSLLGVIITPIILLFSLGSTTVVPLTQSLIQLTATVLFPLCIGKLINKAMNESQSPSHSSNNIPSTIGQVALLFIIYTTFCDAFFEHDMALSATDVLLTVVLVVILQTLFSAISFYFATRQFSPQDAVAAVFCSTHKSLTLGIPILRIMYHGLSHASLTGFPLLVYHPCQLLLGSIIAPPLAMWAKKKHLPL